MPLVWLSSWRGVMVSVAVSSLTRNSCRAPRTGSSSSTRPACTSWRTSVAVYTFEIDPIWKRVSGVASTPVATLAEPLAATTRSSPRSTPTTAPGTPWAAIARSRVVCSDGRRVSRAGMTAADVTLTAMFADRVDRVRARMQELDVEVLLLSVGPELPYLTGYEAMPLERLTMLVLPVDGDATLLVPRLEAPRVTDIGRPSCRERGRPSV